MNRPDAVGRCRVFTPRHTTNSYNLYFIRGNAPALFGREWINVFIPVDKWLSDVNVTSQNLLSSNESNSVVHHSSPDSQSNFVSDNSKNSKSNSVSSRSKVTSDKCFSLLKEKFPEVFQEGIGVLKGIKAHLFLQDGASPVFCKSRNIPYALQKGVRDELDRLERDGIISRVESSLWATPIVPVVKADGSIRVCGDFKTTVNPQLKPDDYPIPRVEDLFGSLAKGQRFSKIDLSQAYLHMEVAESDREILTLNTPKGLFRLNRLPFGIKTAPAIWQRAMEQILQGIPGICALLDDVRVTGENDDEHLSRLLLIFERLQKFGLRVNVKKCVFFADELEFCGHVIDRNGLHTSKSKIQAIMEAPVPENVSQLRAFLGTVNYYCRFLANLASILNPLYELLKDGQSWIWSSKCEQAFCKVKEILCSDNVLAHFDPELPIVLTCDASQYGLGAVISHIMADGAERPIAFGSRTLSATERNYSQIDKEALGIVWGVKKFYYYLAGRRFKLITDHKPLLAIFGPKKNLPVLMATRLLHYAIFLQSFNYDIEYKPSKAIANADGLSRLPLKSEDLANYDVAFCFQLSQIEQVCITAADLAKATRADPQLSTILNRLHEGLSIDHLVQCNAAEFSIHEGCLMKGIRVVIPMQYRVQVLDLLHEGHFGMVKMKSLARSYVWWPGIDQDIEKKVRSCSDCLDELRMPPKTDLHHWEPCTRPWQRIHIDFAGPFQNSMFLIVIDAYSKWPEVIQMNSITSSKTIESLSNIFARYGLPQVLVSDNGPQLTSREFSNFLALNGIRHIRTAPFHPASNGQAERFVQTLKKGLRSNSSSKLPLFRRLNLFLFHYRRAPHALTKKSPAELFLGRALRSSLDVLKPREADAISVQIPSSTKFHVGDSVLARCYSGAHKWLAGTVLKSVGSCHYSVQVGREVWKRHLNQLRRSDRTVPSLFQDETNADSFPVPAVSVQRGEVRANPEIPVPPTPPIRPAQPSSSPSSPPSLSAASSSSSAATSPIAAIPSDEPTSPVPVMQPEAAAVPVPENAPRPAKHRRTSLPLLLEAVPDDFAPASTSRTRSGRVEQSADR